MVIGEHFAWGHLPKAAGDATLQLWRLFPDLILEADDEYTNAKHATFPERMDRVAGKLLILNIRRLPAWSLSYAHHVARGGLFPDYEPMPLPSPDQVAASTVADDTLTYMTGGQATIDYWIRQEALKDDFLALLDRLTDVSVAQRQAVQAVGLVNSQQYNREIADWFTPAQIKWMYESNPVWASVERQIYGFTLADGAD